MSTERVVGAGIEEYQLRVDSYCSGVLRQTFTIVRRRIQVMDFCPDIAVADVERLPPDLASVTWHSAPVVFIPYRKNSRHLQLEVLTAERWALS